MLFSALTARHKYKDKGVATSYAWLARKALLNRHRWKQVTETDLVFIRNSTVVSFTDDMSLVDVIHEVIDVEYDYDLSHVSDMQRVEMLMLAHAAADRYFQRKAARSV